VSANERRPAGAPSEACWPTTSLPHRLPVRPDLWAAYPDPRLNFRHATPYGLTVDELRAEWKRQVDAGWARWELELRLHPTEVAA